MFVILCSELHHETEEDDGGRRAGMILIQPRGLGFLNPSSHSPPKSNPVSWCGLRGNWTTHVLEFILFMDTELANLETQDASLLHRASASLDFCGRLWICCHFGFGTGDDALFLRIAASGVVCCWL